MQLSVPILPRQAASFFHSLRLNHGFVRFSAQKPACAPLMRPQLRHLLRIPCRHVDFDAHLRHIPQRRGVDLVCQRLLVEIKRN
jgi:hypothetical protein